VGPRGGGAITAALFLKEFAGDTPWAHFDIAGPAFTERDTPLAPKGGTGVAVRTLLAYLTAEQRSQVLPTARHPRSKPASRRR
jgi:leucyl aminopeptidase